VNERGAEHRAPVRLHDELAGLVRLGVVQAEPIAVGLASVELSREMDHLAEELRHRWAGHAPAEIEPLRPARELYRTFGIDPTKTRPSSEALLRRVLRGEPLPRILNAVDVCNLLSARFLLPMGLYDAAKIDGDVLLRRGVPGESYPGIRKDDVHLDGRPVLVDRQGPFGNPTSDSLRTSVDASTRVLTLVIFAPPASVPDAVLLEHVERARETMERHLALADRPARTRGTIV
jgi:DNA/RNA-binding domain of Phe-tRNA-synthetase-like protein